jgi:hypothetical protein
VAIAGAFDPWVVAEEVAPVVVADGSEELSPDCIDDVSLLSLSRSSLEPSVSSAADPEGEAWVAGAEVFEPLDVAAGAAPVVVVEALSVSSPVCPDDVSLSSSSLSRSSLEPSVSSVADPEDEAWVAAAEGFVPEVLETLDVAEGLAPAVVAGALSVSSPACSDDVSLSSLRRSSLEPSVSLAADPEGEA